jgi:hypothetical protein
MVLLDLLEQKNKGASKDSEDEGNNHSVMIGSILTTITNLSLND